MLILVILSSKIAHDIHIVYEMDVDCCYAPGASQFMLTTNTTY